MSNTTSKKGKKLLVCSDGKSIDAKPFAAECNVVKWYCKTQFNSYIKVDISSDIAYMVREFCEKRAKIRDDNNYPNNQNTVEKKLDEFNFEFAQTRKSCDVIPLIIAAMNLESRSLVDVMLKDINKVFSNMTSDEVYNVLTVNLKEFNDFRYYRMVKVLNDWNNLDDWKLDFNELKK